MEERIKKRPKWVLPVVLVCIFVVVGVLIVINYGFGGKVKSCEDVDFRIFKSCFYNADTLEIMIMNQKDKTVSSGFLSKVNEEFVEFDLPFVEEIEPYGLVSSFVPLPEGSVESVSLVPVFDSGEQCSEKELVVDLDFVDIVC